MTTPANRPFLASAVPDPEIWCLREVVIGRPTISGGRIARVAVHLEAQDALRASFELQWRYPDPVLDPEKSGTDFENLFTLAALLPILNYLLFCERVRIEGPLDAGDAEWVSRLGDATAREIQRQKLTAENPYLRTEMIPRLKEHPPTVPEIASNSARVSPAKFDLDAGRGAVLIDGSAESLLTYAILEEVGLDPLGVFLECPATGLGAAVNAYGEVGSSPLRRRAKVWTNLSLLYDFFLRHLDFLRLNYQTLRADGTPLRLFESEVNALSALPLLWAGRIGHLVLPRRIDSLEKRLPAASSASYPLFDQTRAFDDYVTRFFARKGWGAQQWTLLRPASELIVQRALGSRYPDLFSRQVGCLRPRLETRSHAFLDRPRTPDPREEDSGPVSSGVEGPPNEVALGWNATGELKATSDHPATGSEENSEGRGGGLSPEEEPDRREAWEEAEERHRVLHPRGRLAQRPGVEKAFPCGLCEACRRQVVILTALGYDPKSLGFTPAKIERILAHLRRIGHLPKEARIQRHVLHLLEKSGMETGPRTGDSGEKRPGGLSGGPLHDPYPEAEALRFDSSRAFLDTVPLPFRRRVYGILLEYASGTLRREGREWRAFDLLSSPEMDQPKQYRDLEFLVV